MKKLYQKTSINIGVFFIILLMSAPAALSQQRYVNVSPGVGTLNDSIFSDTTSTGARVDSATIYVLERDGIYLVTGSIEHRFPLTIQAAEGEGARPKVYPAVDDGNESSRLFIPRDNLTVKGLDISNTDELGARNKNTFRIKGDNAVVTIDDCLINEDTQAPFRCDGDLVSIIITNSIISNMDQDYDNGRVVDDRGNPIKNLWLENNTFYNIGSRVLRDGGSYIEWAIINHNTIVNTGRRAFDLGEVVIAEVKNNIFLDCGILGDDTATTAALIQIDSLTSGDVVGKTQSISINNNNFFLAQGYIDNFPDSAAVIPIFNPTAQAYVDETGTGSTMLYEDLEFTNGPAKNFEATTKYWDNPDATVTLPEFDKANEPFDFGYLNNIVYFGSDMGGQLGDLRWAAGPLTQRYVNIPPGVGTLNDIIFADTTNTGARVDPATIYLLERDGIYLVTGSIEHRFPLTLQAEDGEGARPKVYPAVDDGNESARLFIPRDNITVKSLDISNTDELGARNKNTFRIKGDNAVVTIDDCLINEDSQAPFRCDGDLVSIIMTNSIISNMDQDYNNGRVVDDRGNPIKNLWLENNTFYNIGSRVLRDGGSYIESAKINQNTIVNTGRRAFDLGEVVVAEVKNNIFLDCGILGDDTATTAALIQIDSLTSGDVAGKTQSISISNNNFFLAQGYIDNMQADSIRPIPIFNTTAQAYVDESGTGSTMLYEDVEFTNGPAKDYEATTKWYDAPDATVTLPEFDRDNEPFDFGYLNSIVYVGSDINGQLGDLRWTAGPSTGIKKIFDNVFGLKTYPNPFSAQTTIEFELTAKGHVSIEVYNIAGARIASLVNQVKTSGKHMVNWNGSSNNGSLPNGIYFLRIRVGNQLSTTKILIQK